MQKLCLLATALLLSFAVAQAKTTTFNMDTTYAVEPDGILFLHSSDAEVTITGSDRSDVRVVVDYSRTVSGLSISEESAAFEVEVSKENGNLRIRERDSHLYSVGFFISSRTEYTISIEAPASMALQIRGEDDSYRISGFRNGIRLRMEDGRARLRDMSGPNFEFEFEDGFVELDGGSGMLDVRMEDGTFRAENGAFTSVLCSVEDGDLLLATSLADDGDYRLSGDDGTIEFHVIEGGGEFSVYLDDGRARAASPFQLVEDEEHFKQFRLGDGKARVRLRMEDGYINLRN